MFFIIVFIIVSLLVLSLDSLFYSTLIHVLSAKGLDAQSTLRDFGIYNRSIFTNRIFGLLISFLVTTLIFLIYKLIIKSKEKTVKNEILSLENQIKKINEGDYYINLTKDDEFSSLRDEIYKTVVNLKSLKELIDDQKKNLKDEIFNIAHQLKTPLTSIGFLTELLEMDSENSEEYIERLKKELDKLNNFTEQLLKMSKVNSDTVKYEMKPLKIMEIIEDIIRRLKVPENVEISIKGEDFEIIGDEIWLYEAMLNIVKNSIEHTKDRVIIELDSNRIFSLIKVKNNGNTLTEEEVNNIFKRHYSGKTALSGYGIGLNLSKSIIEKHNGEVRVFNDNGVTYEIKFYNVT